MQQKPNGEHVDEAAMLPSQKRWEEPDQPHRSHWWVWVLVFCALCIGGYFAYPTVKGLLTKAPAAAPAPHPVPVKASTAQSGDMDIFLDGLGAVTPIQTVTLKTRVNGQIMDMPFKEGQIVAQNALLMQIDPRPYQAALDQAKGQLVRDQAMLDGAQIDLKRYQDMPPDSVSKQVVDDQVALVATDKGTVELDKANVEAAQVNLDYTQIRSPVAGRIGLRLVDPGNIVQTTDATGYVVITQLQPITVVFTLPEDVLPQVIKAFTQAQAAHTKVRVDAYDRNQKKKITEGYLYAVNSAIDPTTGTVSLKAQFENKNNELFPQQFVNARLLVNTLHDVVIVPSAAVQSGPQVQGSPQSFFIYVVKPDNIVEMRDVGVGPTEKVGTAPTGNDETVITKNLAAGEVVVTDGLDKLQPGQKVTIGKKSATAPSAAEPATQPLEITAPATNQVSE